MNPEHIENYTVNELLHYADRSDPVTKRLCELLDFFINLSTEQNIRIGVKDRIIEDLKTAREQDEKHIDALVNRVNSMEMQLKTRRDIA